ncbi:MAG: glycosyltransferase [Clostridia bacterium]|nr:glycosyltransferase [Clostridia bacterium]
MNNSDIKVSVIMPIYNAYDYLRPAMDSVIDQTLREIEIICVDDGSTDHSLDILKEYQKNDDRIRIVTETNAGPALARNNGIRRARGEYLAFLDADDFFDLSLLETLYNTAKEKDLDIAIADYDIYNSRKASFDKAAPSEYENIFKNGAVTSKSEYPEQILMSTNGAAWNKLFRRSFVLDKNLVFLPDAKMHEDVYFVMTAMAFAERVAKVEGTTIHHRIYSEQSRAKLFRKHFDKVPEVYVKIKEFLTQHGIYAPLSSAFINLSADRCYKVYNILAPDEKEDFWNLLRNKYSELLGWHGRAAEDFYEITVCEFVANLEMYDYKQFKRRPTKTEGTHHKRLSQMFRMAKNRTKIRNFFGKIFGSKKNKEN